METGDGRTSIGFVSTYPPTVCGLASFTSSLLEAIAGGRNSRRGLGVVSLLDRHGVGAHRDVVYGHRRNDPASLDEAVEVLNTFDAVSVQHEFGIFGGPDGDEAVALVAELTVPTAVTFHTVLGNPTERQRAIVERIADDSDRSVVMSRTASERLIRRYDVDPARIDIIPHGADARLYGPSLVTGRRPLVLTWGLIGPGKGLETSIAALAGLVDLEPCPRYLIAGATHPHIQETEGESYRDSLIALVQQLGLEEVVEFDDRYLDGRTLARLVRSADLVVLPYASHEQVTSGVLVEAIAASKPVIATAFPHSLELLSGGAGIVIPHDDPDALSAAVRTVLTDARLATQMRREARRLGEGWFWPTIGRRYARLLSELVTERRSVRSRTLAEVRRVAG